MRCGRRVAYRASLIARLDRFGAGVAEERLGAPPGDRRDRRELLRQAHLRLVVEVGARHVEEALRLIGDRAHDVGMGVAGGVDRDAGGAVEEDVAVNVFDRGAGAAGDDERIRCACRRAKRPRRRAR